MASKILSKKNLLISRVTLNYDESVEEEKKEDDQKNAHWKSVPIYPGSRLTIGISALLVMAVVICHSLTGQALNDILKLIWLHCLGSSEFLRSINELKKCFCDLSSPMTFHWYCSSCFMLVDKNKEKCCPNSFCRKDFTVSGSLTFFVEVPIIQQIKGFSQRQGFTMTFNTVTIGTINVVKYGIFTMVNFTRDYQSIQMFCHVHRTYLLPGTQMGYLFSSRPTFLFDLYI